MDAAGPQVVPMVDAKRQEWMVTVEKGRATTTEAEAELRT
jgi:hypothetical protein